MSIYFGNTGSIELKRKADHAAYPEMVPSDVSVAKRRFTTSTEANQVFIVGDEIEIKRTDQNADKSFKDLQLVKGHDYPEHSLGNSGGGCALSAQDPVFLL